MRPQIDHSVVSSANKTPGMYVPESPIDGHRFNQFASKRVPMQNISGQLNNSTLSASCLNSRISSGASKGNETPTPFLNIPYQNRPQKRPHNQAH